MVWESEIGNGFKFNSEHIKGENPSGNCHPNSAKWISSAKPELFSWMD